MTWARSNESNCNTGLFHADSVKAYIYKTIKIKICCYNFIIHIFYVRIFLIIEL